MTDADTFLAQSFGALRIERRHISAQPAQQSNQHILRLTYPDFTIAIQPQEVPKLPPPAKLEHRQRPPHDCRDLAIYDTEFAISMPPTKYHAPAMKPKSQNLCLLHALEAAKERPGATNVGIIRVHQEIWDETAYRIRVETSWEGPYPPMPPQYFELSDAEMELLFTFANLWPYIGVVKHLLERASAKAYYHVRQRIMARYGIGGAVHEENEWPVKWGVMPARNAADLFMARLTPIEDNIAVGKMPQIRLECGHGYRLSCLESSAVNSKDVMYEECSVCKVRILKPEDDHYLHAVADKNDTVRYAKMQKVWANLVQNVSDPGKPRSFHFMSVFRILGAALDSLKSPDWVAPTAICASRFKETDEVLEHLESIFYDQDESWTRTAEGLLEDLEQEAMSVRVDGVPLGEKVNPPGWDDFVTRWLLRTAYFLAYRRCDERDGKRCDGLHWHRDGLWYGPRVWEMTEAERFEKGEVAEAVFEIEEVMKALDSIEI